MSKISARLLVGVLLLTIHLSLLMCEEERCWNEAISLSYDHPISRIFTWLMRKTPFSLSSIQRVAQALVIGEGVILLTYLFEIVCKCVCLLIQLIIIITAARFYYQISRQDL
jgi:hypothetical protein